MSDMEKTLRGVVRDHRVPADYAFGHNQPVTSKAFRHQFVRWIKNRAITKQHMTTPVYAFVSNRLSY